MQRLKLKLPVKNKPGFNLKCLFFLLRWNQSRVAGTSQTRRERCRSATVFHPAAQLCPDAPGSHFVFIAAESPHPGKGLSWLDHSSPLYTSLFKEHFLKKIKLKNPNLWEEKRLQQVKPLLVLVDFVTLRGGRASL